MLPEALRASPRGTTLVAGGTPATASGMACSAASGTGWLGSPLIRSHPRAWHKLLSALYLTTSPS